VAKRLGNQAMPGEVLNSTLSSAAGNNRGPGIPARKERRGYVLAAATLQVGLLIAYFLFWYGLITWKSNIIAVHDDFACRPAWLCDDKTPAFAPQVLPGDYREAPTPAKPSK